MVNYYQILVPVDGGPRLNHAAGQVIQLGGLVDAKFHLLHDGDEADLRCRAVVKRRCGDRKHFAGRGVRGRGVAACARLSRHDGLAAYHHVD